MYKILNCCNYETEKVFSQYLEKIRAICRSRGDT